MKFMKSMLCFLVLSVALIPAGMAQPAGESASADPEALLKSRIDSVLEVLETKKLDEAEKRRRIEQIVDPVFNYELMAKLSLGPQHWPKLNKQQQEEFIDLFVQRLKVSYFDKITLYQGDTGARIDFKPARKEGDKVHVPVVAQAKGDSVEMLYKMYQSGSGWKVYDAEINGVSIVQSYRSQFNQVMARGTVEDLLQQLRKPAGQDNAEQPPMESNR